MGRPPENSCVAAAYAPPKQLEPPQVVEVADRLLSAESLTDLERRYHEAVAPFITLPLRGFYLLGDASGSIERISCENVSDNFIARYEHLGRRIDPLLVYAVKNRAPASSLDVMHSRSG